MKKISILLILINLLLLSFAFAQQEPATEEVTELPEVVITATKVEQLLPEVTSSYEIITKEEIEQKNVNTVSELLRDIAGINVTQTGAYGGTTSVSIQGQKSSYTLVLIDGMEVNDRMAIGGGSFEFAYLTVDNIEKIEIIKGPQSALYGSNAIAGVINIITKKGTGKPKLSVTVGNATNSTTNFSSTINGKIKNVAFSLSGSIFDTKGISKAKGGKEKDNQNTKTISNRIDVDLAKNISLSLINRYEEAETDIDDGSFNDDPNYIFKKKENVNKVAVEYSFNEKYQSILNLGLHHVKRDYKDEEDEEEVGSATKSWYESNLKNIDWQNNLYINENNTFIAGLEYESEDGSSYYWSTSPQGGEYKSEISKKKIINRAIYGELISNVDDKTKIVAGIRYENNSQFGKETTFKIGYRIKLTDEIIFKQNFATGFKAPTIYELYSPYGDEKLEPDKTTSYDITMEFNKEKYNSSLTYFSNSSDNMIDYDMATWKYKNIGKVFTRGVEVTNNIKINKNINIAQNYTYLHTEDKKTKKRFDRTPYRIATIEVNYQPIDKLNINLLARYKSERMDKGVLLSSYTTVNLSANYKLTNSTTLFLQIENLFDKDYQEVYGYSTKGRSIYGGIKAVF